MNRGADMLLAAGAKASPVRYSACTLVTVMVAHPHHVDVESEKERLQALTQDGFDVTVAVQTFGDKS